MDTDESEIKVMELPEWVKLVNELVKKKEPKSPKCPAEAKSNL